MRFVGYRPATVAEMEIDWDVGAPSTAKTSEVNHPSGAAGLRVGRLKTEFMRKPCDSRHPADPSQASDAVHREGAVVLAFPGSDLFLVEVD